LLEAKSSSPERLVTVAAPHAASERPERQAWAQRVSPALLGFIPVAALASAQGGYFPTSWGWAAVGLYSTAGVALVVRSSPRVTRAEAAFGVAWALVATWIGLSLLWSTDVPQTVFELERVMVYVAGVVAIIALASSRTVSEVLGGLVVAIGAVSTFSLATRLFPGRIRVFDPAATYRLAEPLGYWNGLSVFTAMGMLLALGYAARGRTTAVRAAGAAILPLFLSTFYFTFGRTGWLALGAGVLAAIAVDKRRLQLLGIVLALAPVLALAVWASAHFHGLTRRTAPLAEATRDGHRLALILLLLVALTAAISTAFALAERRVQVSGRFRRVFAAAVLGLVAVILVGVVVRFGGPTLVEKGWRAFKAAPTHSANLNERLLTFSGNGRYDLWRVAWDDAKAHPVLGSGAGTYEQYFLQHQPAAVSRVRDAHGLYIETLAELGPLGLALLAAALLLPLVAAVRRKALPLTGAAFGAYVVFLVHAGSDWDWELPAVTLAALLCAGCLVLGDRDAGRRIGNRLRVGVVAAVVLGGAFAAVGLLGNSALGSSNSALQAGRWNKAATDANRARRLMPWSPLPWVNLGRAQLGAGSTLAARSSFQKALSIDRGDWNLWVDVAETTTGAEQRHALREALALYPRAGFRLSPTGEITGGDTTP
jgi:hypothetical protein